MNKKHIAILAATLLIVSALFYKQIKSITTKKQRQYYARHGKVADAIEAAAKKGSVPTIEQIKEFKAIFPYRSRYYKPHLSIIIDVLTKEPNVTRLKGMPSIEQIAEVIKLVRSAIKTGLTGKNKKHEKEVTDDLIKNIFSGIASYLKFPKPVEKDDEKKQREEWFTVIFNRPIDGFIYDLMLKDKLAHYKEKLRKLVSDIIAGRKQFIGPDTGRIKFLWKEATKKKGKELSAKERKEILDKEYPPTKKAKLSKMARNQLANMIIEDFLENFLKDKAQQMKYRTALLKKLKPQAKHESLGYNPEKIDFLMTVKEEDIKKAKTAPKKETTTKKVPTLEELKKKSAEKKKEKKYYAGRPFEGVGKVAKDSEPDMKSKVRTKEEEKELKELRELRKEHKKAPGKFSKEKLERLGELTRKYGHAKTTTHLK